MHRTVFFLACCFCLCRFHTMLCFISKASQSFAEHCIGWTTIRSRMSSDFLIERCGPQNAPPHSNNRKWHRGGNFVVATMWSARKPFSCMRIARLLPKNTPSPSISRSIGIAISKRIWSATTRPKQHARTLGVLPPEFSSNESVVGRVSHGLVFLFTSRVVASRVVASRVVSVGYKWASQHADAQSQQFFVHCPLAPGAFREGSTVERSAELWIYSIGYIYSIKCCVSCLYRVNDLVATRVPESVWIDEVRPVCVCVSRPHACSCLDDYDNALTHARAGWQSNLRLVCNRLPVCYRCQSVLIGTQCTTISDGQTDVDKHLWHISKKNTHIDILRLVTYCT